jgi:hypothetical protein
LIERDEIDAKGRELGLSVADVERDYVFGLLAGLFGHSPYSERLILKGWFGGEDRGDRPGTVHEGHCWCSHCGPG